MRSRMRDMMTLTAALGVAALVALTAPSAESNSADGFKAASQDGALAGVLLPKRTKLIIDYKRVEIA